MGIVHSYVDAPNLKNTDLSSKLCIFSPPATLSPSSLQVEHYVVEAMHIAQKRRGDHTVHHYLCEKMFFIGELKLNLYIYCIFLHNMHIAIESIASTTCLMLSNVP